MHHGIAALGLHSLRNIRVIAAGVDGDVVTSARHGGRQLGNVDVLPACIHPPA